MLKQNISVTFHLSTFKGFVHCQLLCGLGLRRQSLLSLHVGKYQQKERSHTYPAHFLELLGKTKEGEHCETSPLLIYETFLVLLRHSKAGWKKKKVSSQFNVVSANKKFSLVIGSF